MIGVGSVDRVIIRQQIRCYMRYRDIELSPFDAGLTCFCSQTLIVAAELATALGNTSLAEAYAANASSVKAAFNDLLWDEKAGLFRDNETTTLHPQDGNSLAV